MISALTIFMIILIALVLGIGALVRMLGSTDRSLPVTAKWIDDLSTDRYRPMLRLLDSRDIEFLRSQAGFTPKMEARMRAQRCQIYRGYLRCMEMDFQRVCTALKLVLVQSEQDRPDLSSALLFNQILFATGLLAVRCRLIMYGWGICTVDADGLMRIFDGMAFELRHRVPAASPVFA